MSKPESIHIVWRADGEPGWVVTVLMADGGQLTKRCDYLSSVRKFVVALLEDYIRQARLGIEEQGELSRCFYGETVSHS